MVGVRLSLVGDAFPTNINKVRTVKRNINYLYHLIGKSTVATFMIHAM